MHFIFRKETLYAFVCVCCTKIVSSFLLDKQITLSAPSILQRKLHFSDFDIQDFHQNQHILRSLPSIIVTATETENVLSQENFQPLSDTTNIAVFLVGIFPFIWATIEFWRRIAVGLPFGTGSDSIIIDASDMPTPTITTIGEDNNPKSSRGRQVLGKGAIVVAYLLFGIAAFSVGIAVLSVVTSSKVDPIIS